MNPDVLPYRPCVGVMLINRDGLIFTGERIDTPGAWQMPQGGVDEGESLDQAALRELGEEIGVASSDVELLARTKDWITYDLPDHLVGKVWGGKFRGQKQHWFLAKLLADDSVIDLHTHHPEFARWKWTTRDALLSEIVPFKRHVYERVVAALLP